MTTALRAVLAEAGLLARPAFHRDPQFQLALAAGVVAWLGYAWLGARGAPLPLASFLLVVLWRPLVEELLFRGVLQGWLRRWDWARRGRAGFSLATLATAVLFTAAHLVNRPWQVALPVLIPALLFGYFRDRHGSVWPAVALHAIYNAGYFLVLHGVAFG